MTTPGPTRYVSKPTVVEAMQWNPGDLVQAGVVIGWLMANSVSFHHPSGHGETTTIHLAGDYRPLAPGGWIFRREDGRFYTKPDDEFRQMYEPERKPTPNARMLPPGSVVGAGARVWVKRTNDARHQKGSPFHETWWIEATTYAVEVGDPEIQQLLNSGRAVVLREGS